MYSSGSTLTNNPFVTDPTNAQSRFPDISTSSQHQWPQASLSPDVGYQQPQGMYQQPSYQQQQQQPISPSYSQLSGHLSPHSSQIQAPQPTGLPFQPTSSFGQQLAANINGSSYGYLQGQNGSSQQAYTPAQQQLQNPGYLAQFNPYASIGQGWSGETQVRSPVSQNQSLSQVRSPIPGGTPASTSIPTSGGRLHPREYLRAHKGEIEAWDTYAWKQLLNTLGALKESWEGRVKELEGRATQLQRELQSGVGNYHPAQVQQEGARLQGLHRDAKSHADSVSASSFQMQEVFEGYRQSADVASKRRVREASNAAIQALPDWPSPVY